MQHHLCITEDYTLFDDEMIPYGKRAIEKENTRVINDILDLIVTRIGTEEIVICGEGDAKRMLGRKLEDRIKREVKYE